MSCQGVDVGEFRHRIQILNYTSDKDQSGSPVNSYFTLCHLSAKVEYKTAKEPQKLSKETALTTVVFTIRERPGLDKKMMLVFRENVYNILTILKKGTRKQYFEIKTVHAFEFNKIKNNIPMVGEIKMYSGQTAPSGFLLCDGASYSTSLYPDLFNLINYDYGGTGSSFQVPDLRGRAPIGVGVGDGLSSRGLGAKTGTETHTLSESELAAHTHTKTSASITGDVIVSGNGSLATTSDFVDGVFADGNSNIFNNLPPESGESIGGVTHDLELSTLELSQSGAGNAHNNMQPSLAVNFIIATI